MRVSQSFSDEQITLLEKVLTGLVRGEDLVAARVAYEPAMAGLCHKVQSMKQTLEKRKESP